MKNFIKSNAVFTKTIDSDFKKRTFLFRESAFFLFVFKSAQIKLPHSFSCPQTVDFIPQKRGVFKFQNFSGLFHFGGQALDLRLAFDFGHA